MPNALRGTPASITFRAWDRTSGARGTKVSTEVNGGTAAFSTATEDAEITVTEINDPPVAANLESTALAYTENDGPVAITDTTTFIDVDHSDLQSAVVQITGGFASGEDVLSFATQSGITGSFSAVTGVLTLTGAATLTQYENAIRSVTYANTSESPDTTPRTISLTVNDGQADSNTLTRDIAITSVNDPPTVTLANPTTTLAEDAATSPRIKVADIVVSDDDLGAEALNLAGPDAARFEIDGTELYLIDGTALDFETNPTLDVIVQIDDNTVGGAPDDSAVLAITVTDVDEAPTVTLANVFDNLAEDPSTPRAKVADIVVSDDALGTFELSLAGDDAALFEISGSELFIREGTEIDFETHPFLDVTVRVDDPALGGSPDDTAELVITVVDVNEAPSILNNRLTISGGETLTLTQDDLWASDPDDTPEQLNYTVNAISGGRFELAANPGVAVTNFTQIQVNDGRVRFVQLTPTQPPSYTLTVSDGELTDGPSTAEIDFTPAPVVTESGTTDPVEPTPEPPPAAPEVSEPTVDPPTATPTTFTDNDTSTTNPPGSSAAPSTPGGRQPRRRAIRPRNVRSRPNLRSSPTPRSRPRRNPSQKSVRIPAWPPKQAAVPGASPPPKPRRRPNLALNYRPCRIRTG